jgi:formate-dependent nitrite reductase membrane component NrfD
VKDGSITDVGTKMDSYYGRPIIKEPIWKPQVPVYMFTGGLAGASSVLHVAAELAGNRRLAKTSLYVGAAGDLISPALLISDLGRPERFLNMLRVFKVTSPMSVGTWVLFVSGTSSSISAALELLGILKPVKLAGDAVAALVGPALATYTGTLVANTAVPVWHEARQELPWLFSASASASAGAAAAIFTPTEAAGPARRLAVLGAAAELGLMETMKRRLGFVGEVYDQGEAAKYGRISKVCTAAGAALLARPAKRSKIASIGGGALMLAGGLALRWSVFRAGIQSARDPRYTVIPQRERKQARQGGPGPASDPG